MYIHTLTPTYTQIQSQKPQKHTLYVNVMSLYECIWVYVSVNTCIHLHSHTLKYTQIQSDTHNIHKQFIWVYVSVCKCKWVYVSVMSV